MRNATEFKERWWAAFWENAGNWAKWFWLGFVVVVWAFAGVDFTLPNVFGFLIVPATAAFIGFADTQAKCHRQKDQDNANEKLTNKVTSLIRCQNEGVFQWAPDTGGSKRGGAEGLGDFKEIVIIGGSLPRLSRDIRASLPLRSDQKLTAVFLDPMVSDISNRGKPIGKPDWQAARIWRNVRDLLSTNREKNMRVENPGELNILLFRTSSGFTFYYPKNRKEEESLILQYREWRSGDRPKDHEYYCEETCNAPYVVLSPNSPNAFWFFHFKYEMYRIVEDSYLPEEEYPDILLDESIFPPDWYGALNN
ncbi:hypothetical protein M0E84_03320 [Corynebacterium sp. CCM 9186]|uniref:hypothetical protein n=1 Tax=Corynebacterium meridianum TaxID=2765363 RepID=UPI0020056471|nr:hypothetical protein [Corynebacterium meridianum]MCK7677072.1 hypothetical protein [Corynebacterium meridianum]